MKKAKALQILFAIFIIPVLILSCEKKDDNKIVESEFNNEDTTNTTIVFDTSSTGEIVTEVTVNKTYIINYGSYDGAKSTVNVYNETSKSISNNAYRIINDDAALTSSIQSAEIYDTTLYFMSNNGDQIDILNARTLEVIANPIDDGIVKPRYFAEYNGKAYISCWGNADWNLMEDSYIAVIDLANNTLDHTIELDGGPEGVIIKNGKLYTCLAFRTQLAVIELSTEAVSYIELPAVSQHIKEDVNGKLWVSVVSTYSNPADSTDVGIAIVDPINDTHEQFINIQGIGSNGYMTSNADGSTIYVMGNDPYPGINAYIYELDATNPATPIYELLAGENFNGMGFNNKTNRLYILISPSTDASGTVKIYNTDGTLYDYQTTGISPQNVVFFEHTYFE